MRVEPGAMAVGQIGLLPEGEAWWVRALRLWCSGADGQEALRDQIAMRCGSRKVEEIFGRFTDLMALILEHGRRRMMRHGLDCECVGADEAVFALFCSQALNDREEAMMIACLLMRADVAPIAVSLAQTLGLDLARTAPRPRRLLN
ncbi:hypothetical protein OB2597_06825 [Pseudooceanicola batsensis HTCC2597]|uniref:Uncharacterized protein n=1 Tax=Pseudooceanicola batsensis (strain ATCC BAA-863 / DSM 15984 / KCTC 12145 / HTCC2597) TaxID=252305 RepID=A3TTK0_PSEBH|nr:hypothetical protein [Pseudooceanicola batsensis]EAQ04977.1 hypothetical protein OB2597_06825 [Pseudooceanicola batsensis HTCC2597]